MVKITKELIIKQRENIPYTKTKQGWLLLDLEDGNSFSCNYAGIYIWKLLNGSKNLDQIARQLASHCNISKARAFSDLLDFIKLLYHKKLIVLSKTK